MRWNGGNQLISSAVMKCVVAAAPSVCKAVSWCPLPVPSPRAFCAPQPQSLHPLLVCVHTSTPPGHVLTQSHGTSDPDTRSRLSTIFKTLSEECFCEIPFFSRCLFLRLHFNCIWISSFIKLSFQWQTFIQRIVFDNRWCELRRFKMSGTET